MGVEIHDLELLNCTILKFSRKYNTEQDIGQLAVSDECFACYIQCNWAGSPRGAKYYKCFTVTFLSVPVSQAASIGLRGEIVSRASVGIIFCWHLDLGFSKGLFYGQNRGQKEVVFLLCSPQSHCNLLYHMSSVLFVSAQKKKECNIETQNRLQGCITCWENLQAIESLLSRWMLTVECKCEIRQWRPVWTQFAQSICRAVINNCLKLVQFDGCLKAEKDKRF